MKKTLTIIRDYAIDTQSLLDSAIMLNGPWGAGKTYFVQKRLMPYLEGRELSGATFIADNGANPEIERIKCVYISLNGVESIDEINDRMLLSILGSEVKTKKTSLSKVLEKMETTNFGPILNTVRDIASVFSGFAKDLAVNLGTENSLLIIDDLERVSNELSMKEVLGYFNSYFIEKQKQKVLFVCNEDEIKNQDDYKKIKEKTISWTIKFEPQFEDYISGIFRKSSDEYDKQLSDAKQEYKATLLKLFEDAQIDNLRTTIKIQDAYCKVIRNNVQLTDNDMALRIFRMITMLINETLSEKTNSQSIGFFEALREYEDLTVALALEEYDYHKILDEMIAKYFGGDTYKWLYLPSVHDYISTYYYNKDRISSEIAGLIKQENPARVALDQFHNRYRFETEEEVQQSLTGLMDYVKSGAYNLPTLYVIFYDLQDSYSSKIDKTNNYKLESVILSRVEKMIRDCNDFIDLQERFHMIKSRKDLDKKFKEKLEPIYDNRLEQIKKQYFKNGLILFLDDPIPIPPATEETIGAGKLFTNIIEHGFADRIYKMSSSQLTDFKDVLQNKKLSYQVRIANDEKEVESIKTIIEEFEKQKSDDPWKRYIQDLFITSLGELTEDDSQALPSSTGAEESNSKEGKNDSSSGIDKDDN